MTTHRHGIVLLRPLLRAFLLSLAGGACFLAPWPGAAGGAALLASAALVAVVAVLRWDRTRLVVRGDSLTIEHGLLRRGAATVALEPGRVVEVERSFLGRLLGYGTVLAGELEIRAVPHPERLFGE